MGIGGATLDHLHERQDQPFGKDDEDESSLYYQASINNETDDNYQRRSSKVKFDKRFSRASLANEAVNQVVG